MNKRQQYVAEFHDNFSIGLEFISNQLEKHLEDNEENSQEIEHILDYLYSNSKLDISNIGYETIKQKARKRIDKLAKQTFVDDEVEGVDYEVFHDFWDGFKIVKLLSENSYKKEGNIMSHCVSSYYGNGKTVMSLRDWKNKPHCTIEYTIEDNKFQQVKGKGNGEITPKYVDYILTLCDKLWIEIRDSEMEHLWYENVERCKEWIKNKLYKWVYHRKKDDLIWKKGHKLVTQDEAESLGLIKYS